MLVDSGYYVDPSRSDFHDTIDSGFAVPADDYDTGDIYSDIGTMHVQTSNLIKKYGIRLSAAQEARLADAFHQIQSAAKSSGAWATVARAHQAAYNLAKEASGGREPPSGFSNELHAHFIRINQAMPGGGGGIIGAISSIGSAIQSGVGAVTNNPLWDIARTGVSFIPGVGNAVSAGMAGAAAFGRGQSLADIGLAAARGAIPGGPLAQAAFDVAVGLAKGGKPADMIAAVRNQVPGGALGQAAFDQALKVTQRAAVPPTYASLGQTANRIARTLHAQPDLRAVPARDVASDLQASVEDVRRAIAAIMNRLGGGQQFNTGDVGAVDSLDTCCEREGVPLMDTGIKSSDGYSVEEVYGPTLPTVRVPMSAAFVGGLMRHGHQHLRQGLLAHGFLPRIYQYTGELDGKGGWMIRSGESPFSIAQKVTGAGNRWREILAVNPTLKVVQSGTTTLVQPFNPGQRITLPASWLGTAAPAPSLPGQTTTPVSVPSGPVTPVSTFPAASAAASMPTLRQGSTGAAVITWQSLLLKLGSTLVGKADGIFGPLTDKATRGYQTRMGLTADGIVGPLTWGSALRELASKAAGAPPVGIPPSLPGAPPVAPSPNIVQVAAIQAMLAFFFQHHSELGSFGSDPADMSGTWGPKSTQAMLTFQQWRNSHPVSGESSLPEDGQPDQASVNSLQAQNARDLQTVGVSVPIPGSGPPALPPIITPPVVKAPPGLPPKPPAAPPVTQAGMGGGDDNAMLWLAGGAILLLGAGGKRSGGKRRAA